ncbi:MAG: dihydroneopterin aldolase [Puniceicoccales bacterium]|jgi:dihydroneopterin aldolase|nr:dihydroneopterin aldolase [Puniceicoccales bacterium]
MGDKIFINDLEIFAKHGVFPAEKIKAQRFLISLAATFDAAAAKTSDELSQTIDYAKLLESITENVQNVSFNLIERLAQHLADRVFCEFSEIISLEITVKKFANNLADKNFSCLGFSSTFLRNEK